METESEVRSQTTGKVRILRLQMLPGGTEGSGKSKRGAEGRKNGFHGDPLEILI